MRHFGFFALLLLALFIAMPTALIWATNECQLHANQSAVDECFETAARGKTVSTVTVLGPLAAAVALHVFDSRWKFAALAALAIGPWLVLMI